MGLRKKIRLRINAPLLAKGSEYWLHESTGQVYWIDRKGKVSEYPLREELAGYIRLLSCETKYVKVLETKMPIS